MPAPADETVELLGRWHRGDDAALHSLIELHLPAVRVHVQRLLGERLRKKEDTSDFVQQTMLELLRYTPRFQVENGRQFEGLVVRIVENVLRDRHDWYQRKRRAIDKEQSVSDSGVLQLGSTRSRSRPDNAAARRESRALVRLALELLPDADRQVIVMREYDGLSHTEIAAALGLQEPAARMRLSRALGRLGEKLRSLRDGELA